jgi:hypothetical protein
MGYDVSAHDQNAASPFRVQDLVGNVFLILRELERSQSKSGIRAEIVRA